MAGGKIQLEEKAGFCLTMSHEMKVVHIKRNILCSLDPNDDETLAEDISNIKFLPNGI